MIKEQIVFRNIPIEIERRKGQRRVKLRAYPEEAKIIVSCPYFFPRSTLVTIFQEKWETIEMIYTGLKWNQVLYMTGDTLYLWGEPYDLYVQKAKDYAIHVYDETMIMEAPEDASYESKKAFYEEWLRSEMYGVLDLIIPLVEEKCELSVKEYKVRKMRTRWGTCNPSKSRICLSLKLARYPLRCLEYVLVHELIHLVVPNHGKDFYALLDLCCPNWQVARDLLKEIR